MSKMVSARIPDAIFEQGCADLEEMGSSVSQLVNAAFEYVIKKKALPGQEAKPVKKIRRVITPEMLKELEASIEACTLDIDIPDDLEWEKNALREARLEKYESLG